MKEKVLSLAKGTFAYETPELVLSPEILEISIVSGERTREQIVISNKRKTVMKGFGSVEAPELDFLPVFHGVENELELEVNGTELVPGETLEGNIHFVTDCGEIDLPYNIKVIAPKLKDSKGNDIDDYYALQQKIKANPEEGAALFHNPLFEEVFLYRDEMGKNLYHHLNAKNTKLQSMEEFLVATGKKEPIRFDVIHPASGQKREIEYELQGKDIQDSLKLIVNTWGTIGIRISSTVDFIEPEMHGIWTDEFVDGKDVVDFVILAHKVPEGTHTGKIILESVYERKEIAVTVYNPRLEQQKKIERAKKAATAMLWRAWLSYREGLTSKNEFRLLLRKNQKVIERMGLPYEEAIAGYIPVILQDEAEILQFYQRTEGFPVPAPGAQMQEVEEYILIQYIKYLHGKREEDRAFLTALLEGYRDNGYQSLLLFWVQLQVDSHYEEGPWKAEDIQEFIRQGYNSPLLYSELLSCYEEDDSLIRNLDAVTLATVNYGLKIDKVTEAMAINISFLAERLPRFQPLIFSVLEKLYEKYHLTDTLKSICTLLIRSEIRENRYFPWFKKGVEAHLRLTELYEYYMYTLDSKSTFSLPDSVISYFQYENHLTERCKAFFYAYIVKKKQECPENFRLYGNHIRDFALRQLSRHRISEDMGVIYEALLLEDNVQGSVAQNLPYVMFSELLTCENEQMESVLVVHQEMKEEVLYPLENGQAMISVYTPNVQLYFVDKEGHYHTGTVEHRRQKMLNLEHFAMTCYENGSEHPGLLAFLAVKAMRAARLKPEQAVILHKVSNRKWFRSYSEGKLLLRLYDYYKEKGDNALLLEILDAISPKVVKRERIGEVATDCIYQGMYEKAEKMLLRYGITGCDNKALSMLVQEKIAVNKGEFDPIVVKWAEYLYQQHYLNGTILHYLLQYYMGDTKVLTGIYKKCLDVPEISVEDGSKERLLGQVLFTGAGLEEYETLFLDYYETGKNRVLVKAALSAYAYEYLVGRMELSEDIFQKIEKEAYYAKDDVMVLAALKYYSSMKDFSKKQEEFVELNLEKCAGEGRLFTFMKDYVGKVSVPYEIENTVLIQHECTTDKEVFLHIIDRDGQEILEPMRESFDDVYTKELLLFEGEEKTCYITEEESGKRTEKGTVRRPKSAGNVKGFYGMVNEMIEAEEQKEDSRYESLRRRYEKQHMVAAELFRLQ